MVPVALNQSCGKRDKAVGRVLMIEKHLQQRIMKTARASGWTVFKDWNDSRDVIGGSSIIFIRKEQLTVVVLKEDQETWTVAQELWCMGYEQVKNCDLHFWTEEDWHSGKIRRELR